MSSCGTPVPLGPPFVRIVNIVCLLYIMAWPSEERRSLLIVYSNSPLSSWAAVVVARIDFHPIPSYSQPQATKVTPFLVVVVVGGGVFLGRAGEGDQARTAAGRGTYNSVINTRFQLRPRPPR